MSRSRMCERNVNDVINVDNDDNDVDDYNHKDS